MSRQRTNIPGPLAPRIRLKSTNPERERYASIPTVRLFSKAYVKKMPPAAGRGPGRVAASAACDCRRNAIYSHVAAADQYPGAIGPKNSFEINKSRTRALCVDSDGSIIFKSLRKKDASGGRPGRMAASAACDCRRNAIYSHVAAADQYPGAIGPKNSFEINKSRTRALCVDSDGSIIFKSLRKKDASGGRPRAGANGGFRRVGLPP